MELDELRVKWTEYDRKLETNLRLNRQLLREACLGRAKSALQRLILGLALEAAAVFVVLIALGSFLCAHWAVPRFAFPGVALDLGTIAVFAALIGQLTAAAQIDYGGPIITIQKQIEALRVRRIRYLPGVFLGATLAWPPLLIVACEGLVGLDAYRLFGAVWLLVNLLFGLAVIPVGLWLSKRFSVRLDRSPLLQRLRADLTGHSLNAAIGCLATISEFEHGK